MLSFNSYGEWTKVNEDIDDDSYYIDFATVKEIDGYVVWWEMKDFVKPNDEGFLSSQKYYKGDCQSSGVTYLSWYDYKANMSEGNGEDRSMGILKLEDIMGWIYPPPDSVTYDNLQIVCSLADQSSMSNYDNKLSELILDYESMDWGEDLILLDELEAERTAQQLAFESEQYNQLLKEEIEAEAIEVQRNTLINAYVSNIAASVKSNWRYQGAEDDWTAEVYIVQDRDGTVVAVDVRNTNVGDSSRAKVFKDSIRRAVYKSSPLPSAPDDSVFDRELIFKFGVN